MLAGRVFLQLDAGSDRLTPGPPVPRDPRDPAESTLAMQLSLRLLPFALALLGVPTLAEESMDRLREEVSAGGEVREAPDLGAKEAAARAGLAKHLSDALVDIMAMLLHGSDSTKDGSIEQLGQLAINTNEGGREQARMFRSAVVAGGALPALLAVLESPEEKRQFLAASAIHTLAIDDPTTDEDNFISEEICQTGAVPPLVKLLSSTHEGVQSAATAALSSLGENPICAQMIVGAGAVEPLMMMAQYGGDFQKLGAMNTLEVLDTTSLQVRKELRSAGERSSHAQFNLGHTRRQLAIVLPSPCPRMASAVHLSNGAAAQLPARLHGFRPHAVMPQCVFIASHASNCVAVAEPLLPSLAPRRTAPEAPQHP